MLILSLLPSFLSSAPSSKPLSKLAGPPSPWQLTASTCCQLFHFCLPWCLPSPLAFSHSRAGCCSLVQLSILPLQPPMPMFWADSAQQQNPSICAQKSVTHRKSSWWYLRTLGLVSLERKKQNWIVLVALYMVSDAPLVCLYWEVIPGRNIFQFLMGMKANCNLQLNSSFCF